MTSHDSSLEELPRRVEEEKRKKHMPIEYKWNTAEYLALQLVFRVI